MIKSILLILLVFTVSGCDTRSQPDKTIPIQTGDTKITDLLVTKLKDNSDWYRIVDQSTIEIEYPPPSYVIDYVNQETDKIIPRGRSSAISPDFLPQVIDELKSKDIRYNLVMFGGEQWLVWDKENSEKVNSIINTVALQTLNARDN